VVVRMADDRWLALEAPDRSAALELGYFCGNLHWRVRFNADRILIALEGPEEDYLARLHHLLASGKAKRAPA
jgi:urease accessory protein